MLLAWRESRYRPGARTHLSSASGLLQFTSETWLQNIYQVGKSCGAGTYALLIHRSPRGLLTVQNLHMRQMLLKLRDDPVMSAKLAAAAMNRQRQITQDATGRRMTSVDLYLLHVLGPNGSAKFHLAALQQPTTLSTHVVRRALLHDAGLLAADGGAMTVANTYTAIKVMLVDHSDGIKANDNNDTTDGKILMQVDPERPPT